MKHLGCEMRFNRNQLENINSSFIPKNQKLAVLENKVTRDPISASIKKVSRVHSSTTAVKHENKQPTGTPLVPN